MVAGPVVERPVAFVVRTGLQSRPAAVALRVPHDQDQFDQPLGHRIAARRQSHSPIRVELGTCGAAGGHRVQRRQVRGCGRRTAAVAHQERAQRLTDVAKQPQVGVIEVGVPRQQVVVDQPRPGVDGIGEPVGSRGQLNGVDQRLNPEQRPRRRLGFIVGEPTRGFRCHKTTVGLHDRYINLTGHA